MTLRIYATNILYAQVMGGIYGNEPPASASAPIYVTLTFLLLPIFYGIPMCLMVIDLEHRLPNPEGWIGWIRHEFGDIVGNHNAYWTWVSFLIDAASYPCITADYAARRMDNPTAWDKNFIAIGAVVLLSALKIFPALMGHAQGLLFLAASLPTLIFFGYGVSHINYNGAFGTVLGTADGFCNASSMYSHDSMAMEAGTALSANEYGTTRGFAEVWSPLPMGPAAYDERYSSLHNHVYSPATGMGVGDGNGTAACLPNVDWSLLMPFALWINAGYVTISAITPDLENPKRNLPLLITLLLPITTVFATLPYVISLSVYPDSALYTAGFFSTVAGGLGGEWLGDVFVYAGGIATLGCFASQIIPAEEAMASGIRLWRRRNRRMRCRSCAAIVAVDNFCSRCGNAVPQAPLLASSSATVLENGDDHSSSYLSISVVSTVVNGVLACGLVLMPFEVLVQVTMVTLTPIVVLFILTFFRTHQRATGQ